MKKHNGWSYAPYKPLFFDVGDIYICRVAPAKNAVTFDWLPIGAVEYSIYCRERAVDEFTEKFELVGKTAGCSFTIENLATRRDFEFYVEADGKKSRVRLARTGEAVGDAVVNYLHRDDMCYSFSGRYLCSPSIVRHPDGYLLSSMDVYAGGYPQNLTLIFRSDDDGKSWHYVSELFPCFWGKMVIHRGELYMFGCSTEYGDMLIGKSTDGGKTFTEPTILFRGGNGKNGEPGCHRNPTPVIEHDGRIWTTVEWGAWSRKYHAVMIASAPADADLLDAASWEFSEPVKYNPSWEGLPKGFSEGNIEGSPIVGPDGQLYAIYRYSMRQLEKKYGLALKYRVNTKEPGAPMEYVGTVKLDGNDAKFEIGRDPVSGYYYTIACRLESDAGCWYRNRQTLFCSKDFEHFEPVCDLLDYRHCDPGRTGFQYPDWMIEGDDILYVNRVAINNAANMHDSNYQTFHRIKNFRKL